MSDEPQSMPCHPEVLVAPDRYGTYVCTCKRAYFVTRSQLTAVAPMRRKADSGLPSAEPRDTVDPPTQQENIAMTDTDTSTTVAPDDAAVPAAAPVAKHRVPKGALEAQVREITDAYSTGCLSEHPSDKPLTPHAIANLIAKRYGMAKAPSAGAVTANLDRWTEVGFAVMSTEKPRAFVGYTPEAVSVGLSELKARSRVGKAADKKAAKEAAKAAAPAPEAEPEAPAATDVPVGTGV